MNAKRIPYRGFVSAITVLLASLLGCCGATAANELAIGRRSKTVSSLNIPINPPVELDWKTRDAILDMRKREVDKYPMLLWGQYEPDSCFDLIEDNRPWWGLAGLHVWRQGRRAIDGLSKESEYILNPFRLAAAEPVNIGIFDPRKVTQKDVESKDFPFFWKSGPLKFDAAHSMATITIDVTGYHHQLARWIPVLTGDTVIQGFSLIAYNARDFGLPYMYLDPKQSINVRPWAIRYAIEIPQMIHCGSSCGYPGGCNNMSPHTRELDENRINKLPARAYLKLWRLRPRDVDTEPADFAMVIDFI